MHAEEIPEPDEPDEPDEEPERTADAATALAAPLASLGFPAREFEFKTEAISAVQLADGTTLAARLTEASQEGWDFVQVVEAGEKRFLLLRRVKRGERKSRPVGFFPPSRS
jgi:hypothetical protein